MCLIRTRSADTTPTVLIKLLTADGYLTHRYKSLGFSERFDEDDNENMLKRIKSSSDLDLREQQSRPKASSGTPHVTYETKNLRCRTNIFPTK